MVLSAGRHLPNDPDFRRILGVDFFGGTARQAVERMRSGGLLVVPAAPALKDLSTNAAYREALLEADLTITDSAFMILLWNLIQRDRFGRLSGLAYLRDLLRERDVQLPGKTVWVMAGASSAACNLTWLQEQGITVPEEAVHLAPVYGREVSDSALLECLEHLRPSHVVITLGGGTQERLGLYLKRHLSYLPAIHCVGAAIAFLSGDQVRIPVWADRFYLGWLYRCVSNPKRYVPRYWHARKLFGLLVRYRSRLPPLLDRRLQ